MRLVAFSVFEAAHHQHSRGRPGLLVQPLHCLPLEMEPHCLFALEGANRPRAATTRGNHRVTFVQDGSRQEKRLVLLAAILSSTLDIVSLPIALVRVHLSRVFVLHFSFFLHRWL